MATHRIPFDFNEETWQRIQKLKQRLGRKNSAAVFGVALRLLEWYYKRIDEGWKICIMKGDLIEEVNLKLDQKKVN